MTSKQLKNDRKKNKCVELPKSSNENEPNDTNTKIESLREKLNKLPFNDCCSVEKIDLIKNDNHSKSDNKINDNHVNFLPKDKNLSPKGPKESKSLGPFEANDNYLYLYHPKSTKSVHFTNQVTIAQFNGDNILCETKEPLKKELDQQVRNKEIRKEHLTKFKEIDNVYLF